MKSYIYPQFHAAQKQLAKELKLTPDQCSILNQWMERHVFEVGTDYHEDIYTSESRRIDMTKEIEYHAARKIAEEMFNKGLYVKQINSHGNLQLTRHTILVFGSPQFVGPGTREARDLSSEEFAATVFNLKPKGEV